jgi:hypothetical protein
MEEKPRQKKVGDYMIAVSILLGSGNFGTVHPAFRDNKKYAVKMIPLNKFSKAPLRFIYKLFRNISSCSFL